jgi:hypothetical protein
VLLHTISADRAGCGSRTRDFPSKGVAVKKSIAGGLKALMAILVVGAIVFAAADA